MKSRWNQALVVSSNVVHCSTLEFQLAKRGFIVTVAADAKEAFRIAEKHLFGLIITDFSTPHGTGIDLARQLRFLGDYDDTPLVLLADEYAEFDLNYVRKELWMYVAYDQDHLDEVVGEIAEVIAEKTASA
jgi:CheY-like chemotaxis protein